MKMSELEKEVEHLREVSRARNEVIENLINTSRVLLRRIQQLEINQTAMIQRIEKKADKSAPLRLPAYESCERKYGA